MERGEFRFKHFSANHTQSSMKIGVDAVLLGAWAGTTLKTPPRKILDVGTGCGIIALCLAQRFSSAQILGIDIDEPSIDEARYNVANSLWAERLEIRKAQFPKDIISESLKYDLIVSNPPYFKSGIINPATSRERARHQESLSASVLVEKSQELLENSGRLSIIFPYEQISEVKQEAEDRGWHIVRECRVKDNDHSKIKRVMMEFSRSQEPYVSENITMFNGSQPTEEYRNLCKEFYLKF